MMQDAPQKLQLYQEGQGQDMEAGSSPQADVEQDTATKEVSYHLCSGMVMYLQMIVEVWQSNCAKDVVPNDQCGICQLKHPPRKASSFLNMRLVGRPVVWLRRRCY